MVKSIIWTYRTCFVSFNDWLSSIPCKFSAFLTRRRFFLTYPSRSLISGVHFHLATVNVKGKLPCDIAFYGLDDLYMKKPFIVSSVSVLSSLAPVDLSVLHR